MSERNQNDNEDGAYLVTQTQDLQIETKDDASEKTASKENVDVASLGLTQREFEDYKDVKYFDLFTVGKKPACRFCNSQPCIKYKFMGKINQYIEEVELIYGENKTNKGKRYKVYKMLSAYRGFVELTKMEVCINQELRSRYKSSRYTGHKET